MYEVKRVKSRPTVAELLPRIASRLSREPCPLATIVSAFGQQRQALDGISTRLGGVAPKRVPGRGRPTALTSANRDVLAGATCHGAEGTASSRCIRYPCIHLRLRVDGDRRRGGAAAAARSGGTLGQSLLPPPSPQLNGTVECADRTGACRVLEPASGRTRVRHLRDFGRPPLRLAAWRHVNVLHHARIIRPPLHERVSMGANDVACALIAPQRH